jgi:site-specific recombinase XerD
MGKIQDQMTQDLLLGAFAPATQSEYLRCAKDFVRFHMVSPDKLGEAEVKEYLQHLVVARQFKPASMKMHIAALKFLYVHTLRRPEVVALVPWPIVRAGLPDILSGSEVVALLEAVESPTMRALFTTVYGCGLRISEACGLGVADVDSKRMVLHVRGKGGRDRFVALPNQVLATLRNYWRSVRPRGPLLFPGQGRTGVIAQTTVRVHLGWAVEKCGLKKRVTPHGLRHAFATHHLELGTDLRVIQVLLGHANLNTTTLYARVTDKHLSQVQSPLDVLGTEEAKRLG